MSGPRVIAQAALHSIIAFPGWKFPTLLRGVWTIDGAGAATKVAGDTVPTTFELANGGAGLYTLTFTKCKRIGRVLMVVMPPAAVAANCRHATPTAYSDVNAGLGVLGFAVTDLATPTLTNPVNNSRVEITLWADFG